MDLLTLGLFLLGFGLLIIGAELLIRGSSQLAIAVGISPLVVGLTVVAFGTSAPELAVSVSSAYKGEPDLTIGNVVGSNILNILLVLGIAAVVRPLAVAPQLLKVDVPLMIIASLVLYLLSMNGHLDRLDGLLLFAVIVVYISFSIYQSRRQSQVTSVIATAELQELKKETDSERQHNVFIQLLFIVVGLLLLVVGSQLLVSGAVKIAQFLGWSELVIGLTIIAIGTSLPEIAASVVAALHNERDIVIGNVVGSNLFNILLVLGLSTLVSPAGIAVSNEVLYVDMPIMIAVAVLCLPIFFIDHLVTRWEGGLFLGYYVAYTVYLLLSAQSHAWLPYFTDLMLWIVIPITLIGLIGQSIWLLRFNKNSG